MKARIREVSPGPSTKQKRKADGQFFNILVYGLSLSFGGVLASLATVRATAHGFTLEYSSATIIAFVCGSALMVPCFKAIFSPVRKGFRRIAWVVVITIGLSGFLYPLRFMPVEKRRDISIGLVSAVIALSGIAGLLLLSHRFLEADAKSTKH